MAQRVDEVFGVISDQSISIPETRELLEEKFDSMSPIEKEV